MKLILIIIVSHLFSIGWAKPRDSSIEKLKLKGKRLGWTFQVGKTSISHLTTKQFTGLATPQNWKTLAPWHIPKKRDLPTYWDWRDKEVVTEVRDQAKPQYCGSCWAHGTIAVVEAAIVIATGEVLDLSEQQLVSCSPSYGSCRGGYFAFGFYKVKGAFYEEDFPYEAQDVACKTDADHHEQVVSWGYVGDRNRGASIEEMKQAIIDYGPIAVTVSASGAWKYYKSGVYNECNSNNTNHIVALVGWDDDEEAWFLKNSHGTEWGEEGYMRIKYTGENGGKCNNVGANAAYVVYERPSLLNR